MKRTTGWLCLCAVLLILNILFIWGNSLLPGEISGAISRFVKDVLAKLLFFLPQGSEPEAGHGLLRKLAHFTEFACLGVLLSWLLAMVKKPVFLAFFCGTAVAALDETIQRFVPGRGPSVWDVLIDASGVLLGVMILYIVIVRRRKQTTA